MRVALVLALAVGCSFPTIDHEGQLEPCLPGYAPDAGRCWRASDAAIAPRDASTDAPTLDAPEIDGGCELSCDGDELLACDGARLPSACDSDTAVMCRAGELVRVACPGACAAASPARCELDPSFEVGSTGLDARSDLTDLVVPVGAVYDVDTDTGRIVSGAEEIRAAGAGVLGGAGFQTLGSGSEIGVLVARSIRVLGTLRARGTASLALVAQLEIETTGDGAIDVSADAAIPGAGGGLGAATTGYSGGSTCADNPNDAPGGGTGGTSTGFYASGGGGGGLGSAGAIGGRGEGCSAAGAPGPASFSRAALRGGYGGGGGGDRQRPSGPSAGGGAGGGGLMLVAGLRVLHAGTIDMSGGGGGGGELTGAGGGGGAGGTVWMEAPSVERIAGSVIGANGGGGGGGGVSECVMFVLPDRRACAFTPPASGAAGDDGTARAPRAAGGTTSDPAQGGAGGRGSDASGMAEPGGAALFNGGGGGGGAGQIVIRTADGTSPGGGATYPTAPSLVLVETL